MRLRRPGKADASGKGKKGRAPPGEKKKVSRLLGTPASRVGELTGNNLTRKGGGPHRALGKGKGPAICQKKEISAVQHVKELAQERRRGRRSPEEKKKEGWVQRKELWRRKERGKAESADVAAEREKRLVCRSTHKKGPPLSQGKRTSHRPAEKEKGGKADQKKKATSAGKQGKGGEKRARLRWGQKRKSWRAALSKNEGEERLARKAKKGGKSSRRKGPHLLRGKKKKKKKGQTPPDLSARERHSVSQEKSRGSFQRKSGYLGGKSLPCTQLYIGKREKSGGPQRKEDTS